MLVKLAQLKMRLERSAFALPLAILAAGLMLAISELAYNGAQTQLTRLMGREQIHVQLLNLWQRITEAESSQRGYLLTGKKEYLVPYEHAASDTRNALILIKNLNAHIGEPENEPLRVIISDAAELKLKEMHAVLELFERGDTKAAREMILTDTGRVQMNRIEQTLQLMVADENHEITMGLEEIFDTLLLNRLGIAAMTAISLLVLIMFLRQSKLLLRHQQQQQSDLQAQRDYLEIEVKRRTADLTELARHLQTAREDERARLARDLHDELGATLTAAKLDIARMRPKLQNAGPEVIERLAHLTETLNSGITLKRRIIEDLRPSTLDNLGLCTALGILCREFDDRLDTHFTVDLAPVHLTPSAELTVFRLVQETLNNMAKYASAKTVCVTMHERDGCVIVRIVDDGAGFDTGAVTRSTHGLAGMRFRVEAEQGVLKINSEIGVGTTIEARFPVAEMEAPSEPHDDAKRAS